MTLNSFEMIMNNSDTSQNESMHHEYLRALANVLHTQDGRLVLSNILSKCNLFAFICNETQQALHNHALTLFREMMDADPLCAADVLLHLSIPGVDKLLPETQGHTDHSDDPLSFGKPITGCFGGND